MYIIIKAIGTNEHRMTKTARKKKRQPTGENEKKKHADYKDESRGKV